MHNGAVLSLDGTSTLPPDGAPSVATDDAALVQAAQLDPAAFGPLYLRYLDRIYRYVRARTASEDDAADVVQQVFLSALAALPRYRDRKVPFAAWLFRIARNAVIDVHRRRRTSVTWDLLPEGLQGDLDHDLEDGVMRQEASARLRTLLTALDAEKRELLALRFAAGLTAAEIAAVVGKSEAATKKQLARLMQSLKEKYDDSSR